MFRPSGRWLARAVRKLRFDRKRRQFVDASARDEGRSPRAEDDGAAGRIVLHLFEAVRNSPMMAAEGAFRFLRLMNREEGDAAHVETERDVLTRYLSVLSRAVRDGEERLESWTRGRVEKNRKRIE